MTNVGKTRSYGAEMSASWRPNSRWMFSSSYGYTNARFVDFCDGQNVYDNKCIPYVPRNTVFIGASHLIQVKASWIDQIRLNVNAKGIGDIYWNEENSVKQPFYALLSASLRFEKDDYSLEIWGDNLTDTQYNSFYFVSIENAFLQKGNPLRCGVTLRMNFKSK